MVHDIAMVTMAANRKSYIRSLSNRAIFNELNDHKPKFQGQVIL